MPNLPSRLKILVTGAGAPGVRGTLFTLRNNPDKVAVEIVGTDISSDVVGKFFVDRFYRVPPPESPEYIPEITRICGHEGISVVIPQTTREVDSLSKFRDDLRRDGINVGVASFAAVQIANDKGRLSEAAGKAGIPIPACRLTLSESELREAATTLGYPDIPVVVKPPFSNGMRGFRVLKESAWDLNRFLSAKPDGAEINLEELIRIVSRGDRWPELMVMEYLPGDEYTVDAFRGGRVGLAIPRRRAQIRSGITFRGEIEMRDDLENYSLTLAELLDLQYAFGFQFKMDRAGLPRLLECNPRVQGTMAMAMLAGHPIPWYAVRELIGQPVEPGELPPMREGNLRFFRYWGGIGVDGETRLYEI